MDVDRPARELLAQVVREDLHVAGEYHQLGAGFVDHLHQCRLLLGLGFFGHRQIDEADALALGHGPQVQVVGDDGGDGHVHLALVVAVQQVGEAMVELADHQQHAHRFAGVVQFPAHVEGLGNLGETGLELGDVAAVAVVETEHRAHEELAAEVVVELRHFTDVAAIAGQIRGHRRDNAGGRRTADFENERVLFVLHGMSSGK